MHQLTWDEERTSSCDIIIIISIKIIIIISIIIIITRPRPAFGITYISSSLIAWDEERMSILDWGQTVGSSSGGFDSQIIGRGKQPGWKSSELCDDVLVRSDSYSGCLMIMMHPFFNFHFLNFKQGKEWWGWFIPFVQQSDYAPWCDTHGVLMFMTMKWWW